jgi:transcriptional antiterminator NusG
VSDESSKLADESPADNDSAAVAQQDAAQDAAETPGAEAGLAPVAEPVSKPGSAGPATDATPEQMAAEGEADLSETAPADGDAAEDGDAKVEETNAEAPESEAAETAEPETAEPETAETEEDEDTEEEDTEAEVAEVEPIEEVEPEAEDIKMDWYILKVQSNREKSISEALKRKIAVEGLDPYFGEVVVPVEKVTEFKGGKKKVVNRKLYPGYIVNMHINDDTWFAVRETSGIGDFTGSGGKPTPMLPHEIARIIQTEEEETEDAPKLNINFEIGDQVKVNDGNFESFEGEVHAIDEHSGRITVMINIFGRSTPVELEYWQVEQT